MYKRNSQEKDIRTRRNHFVSSLSVTEKMLSMHIWEIILEQAEITLNMLRPSRHNPNISVHAILERYILLQQNTFGSISNQVQSSLKT